MLTKYFVKQRMVQIVLCIGTAALFLAACASNNVANTNVAPTSATINAASAIVKHTPTGTTELAWNPATHLLTVHVALTGLAANSIHPTSIYAGSCNNAGKEVYPLGSVKADGIGFANGITKIKDVTTGIPASGWYVSVHNGPALTSVEQSLSISCADIVNPAASTKAPQDVQATLLGTAAPGQSASGTAQLTLNNNQLTVVVSLQGLVANFEARGAYSLWELRQPGKSYLSAQTHCCQCGRRCAYNDDYSQRVRYSCEWLVHKHPSYDQFEHTNR